MDSQMIQTVAAVIQAAGAVLFFGTVFWDARNRWWDREQERRKNLIRRLHGLWRQSVGINVSMTDEELAGFYTPRQIEFFNAKLREQGETWTYE
jgi:hypothetical protein